MKEASSESVPRIFKAGQFWSSNVFGATLAGGLGGVLMLVVMAIVVSGNPTANNILFASGLALVLMLSIVCLVPGNLIAAYPYIVSLEEGKGLELRAPTRTVYIPIEDVRDVKKSYLQPGYVVHLKRRRRLLGSFLIPWYFGDQAEPLANAIREELRRHVEAGLP
ncbi:MAG TPA: hypothetical protein VEK33_25705 [Terriglobales bacterium]|nr:hypothetical protein [Terriglobales bacterium]